WLRERLSAGAVTQREIKTAAVKDGFSWATMRRAKDALGVATEKSGYQGPSQWRLKDAPSRSAQPHIPRVSTFEQPVENTDFTGSRSTKDAQSSNVSTFGLETDIEVRL